MSEKSMSLLLERLLLEGRVFLFDFNIRQFAEYAYNHGYFLIEDHSASVDECLSGKYYGYYGFY